MPQLLSERTERQENIPVEACRFAADITMGKTEGGLKPVPFTALARTAEPVAHWYWGPRCLHDFSGMEAAEVMTVDYCHFSTEVLGKIDQKKVTPEGLQLSGALIPFTADDRASEVIHKSAQGVPYQASIDFDEFELIVEDVPAGFSTEVNGQQWAGPLTVFRKWKLHGLGICPRGVDDGTSVKFSRKLSGQTAAVTRFSKGQPMGGESEAKPTDNPAEKPVETPAEKPADKPADKPTDKPAETPAASTTAPAGTTQLSRAEMAKPFVKEFGDTHGLTLFAKHDTIEAARVEFCQLMAADNKRLSDEVAKFSKGPQGESPASFGGSGQGAAKPNQFANLSEGLTKFAAGIRIPGKKY